MPHMYILECADGSYYVGSSWDAEARLWEHNAGRVDGYTKRRRPVRLVYAAWFDRIEDAYAAEKRVQGWGRRKRELLIHGREDELPGSGSRSWAARRAWPAKPPDGVS
ncbi:GIY-YIG nuclease family protein [Agrococcus terreus]|uniref:GIY-YIG domain-containing protein n=1 Tax=Agrococcus terreus TaxID=574649 RepID=A0ABQ2KN15_9MICO|nr:GIY-YIG nuclease family protein [Agrococcus terreus]GGN87217.1 hypothetical protein GCM10010968_21500 [Agrococcus terreus]